MNALPTRLPCNHARLRQEHGPHDWEPQPGMDPVHCPGHGQPETVADWHAAGCARACSEQHTYAWGRCALAPESARPEPTISIGRVETEADGQPGIVLRSIPLTAWDALITVAKWVSRGKAMALDADPDIAPAYPDAAARHALGALDDAGLLGDRQPAVSTTTDAADVRARPTQPWSQVEARAFNAVQPALSKAGEWLPLSVRRAVARAVLAELKPELDDLDRYEEVVGELNEANTGLARRAARAEAALREVLDLFAPASTLRTDGTDLTYSATAVIDAAGMTRWRAALNGEQPAPGPAATEATDVPPLRRLESRAVTAALTAMQAQGEWLPMPAVEAVAKAVVAEITGDAGAGRCSCGGRFPLNHLHADQHQLEEQP